MDRFAKLLVKFTVTALLFWFAASAADLPRMLELLAKARPDWLAVSLALMFGIIVLDALSFSVVMRILGHRLRFRASLVYGLAGMFFGNLAPSTFGGDIFRAVQMQRLGAPIGTALRPVLTMRFVSFATLIAVILLGLPIALEVVRGGVGRTALIAIAASGGAALIAAYAMILALPQLRRVQRLSFLNRILALVDDFRRVHQDGAGTVICLALAVAQHVVRVAVLAAVAASLQLEIPFATLFALAPAALLAAMIPISLGSWGLREAAFVVFLGSAGVAGEAALSLSIAFGLLRLVMGAIGGATWLVAGSHHFAFDLGIDTKGRADAETSEIRS
ncbi:MAG: flippase-like domain-containing protein [Novosphingobium sp.]|nr:flippase-like domain-containing protein [Novosphingobium sp.]